MAATGWQEQLRRPGSKNRRSTVAEVKRPKRRIRRPAWDDTSSDLTAYKPSPEELERRHQIHKPKPLSERKYLRQYQDLLLQQNKENQLIRKTIYQENVERKKALIKEIFHNQEMELHSVLAETDKAMANVKDLFGDDPMKFRGLPQITSAPNAPVEMNGSLLAIDIETRSRLNVLSDSIMRHPALNDVTEDSDFEHEHDEAGNLHDPYHSNFDFDYYKKLLQREQAKEHKDERGQKEDPQSSLTPDLDSIGRRPFLSELGLFNDPKSELEHKSDHGLDSGDALEKPTRILSASMELADSENKCSKKRETEDYTSDVVACAPGIRHLNHQSHESGSSTFDRFVEMKKMLEGVEAELNQCEKETKDEEGGRKTWNFIHDKQQEKTQRDDKSTFTKVLASIIKYMKESEVQMQADKMMLESLVEDFQEQRALIDALTADIITSQEENEILRNEFDKFRSETNQEIIKLKQEMLKIKSE